MINLRLTIPLMLLLALITGGFPVRAQEVKALPVPAVESEPIPMLGKAPIVIELFSSQACVFCPKADRLFADLLKQDNVIGLACHIDYFDVREGALSRPFCTKRQNWYMEVLGAGPNYTPQMVVNGMHDVIGYKFDSVIKTLQRSSYSEIKPLTLTQTKAKGTWKLTLPLDKLPPKENLQLWLALYDEPHALNIAEGRNKGKKTVYYNIVSSLGSTTAEISKEVFVTPPLKAGHAGFVVILQDMQSGQIYGVARHKIKTS